MSRGCRSSLPSLDVEYTWFEARSRAEHVLPTALVGARRFLDTGVDAPARSDRRVPDAQRAAVRCPIPIGDDFARLGGRGDGGSRRRRAAHRSRSPAACSSRGSQCRSTWRGVSLVPEVGWHETLYDSRCATSASAARDHARVDLNRRACASEFASFVHVLEPRAGYALAYTRSQERNALFVPATAVPLDRIRALDLDSVTRDDADRIARASRATAGFGNRLYGNARERHEALLADFTLLGLLRRETTAVRRADRRRPRVSRSNSLDLGFHADFDPERGALSTRASFERAGTHAGPVSSTAAIAGRAGSRSCSRTSGPASGSASTPTCDHINQDARRALVDLTARWSVSYGVAYSIEGNRALANQGLVEYRRVRLLGARRRARARTRKRGVDAKLVVPTASGSAASRRTSGPSLLDGM